MSRRMPSVPTGSQCPRRARLPIEASRCEHPPRCRRRLNTDPLSSGRNPTPSGEGLEIGPIEPRLMAMEPAWEEGVAERGGLGGGPPAASRRGAIHQGHQPTPAAEPEHRAGSPAQRGTAAIRAATDAIGGGHGRGRHPGVAPHRRPDARDGHRRAHRLGAGPDHPARPGPRAAATASAARPLGSDHLSTRRACPVGPVVPTGGHPARARPGGPATGDRGRVGLLPLDRGPHDPES